MILDEKQLVTYFDRIGLSYEAYRNRPLDAQLLSELSMAHSITIPFENLDILQGKLLSLDGETLYDKIILNHRGGNCFELNGLCGIFLRSLGFGVSDYFSRFFRDAGDSIPMRRHRLLKVEATDGTFLWDIGIGQRSPRYPLRLVEGLIQRQCGETYRFAKESFYGWVLYDFYKDKWERILSFTEEPQADVDFVSACVWCELHPDSPFNKQNMISIKTENGRKSIDGNDFKIFEGNKLVSCETLDDKSLAACMQEHFGLKV